MEFFPEIFGKETDGGIVAFADVAAHTDQLDDGVGGQNIGDLHVIGDDRNAKGALRQEFCQLHHRGGGVQDDAVAITNFQKGTLRDLSLLLDGHVDPLGVGRLLLLLVDLGFDRAVEPGDLPGLRQAGQIPAHGGAGYPKLLAQLGKRDISMLVDVIQIVTSFFILFNIFKNFFNSFSFSFDKILSKNIILGS